MSVHAIRHGEVYTPPAALPNLSRLLRNAWRGARNQGCPVEDLLADLTQKAFDGTITGADLAELVLDEARNARDPHTGLALLMEALLLDAGLGPLEENT